MTGVEFSVKTAKGAVIKTFGDRDMALRYADDCAAVFPGLEVFEVTHRASLERRILPAPALRIVAGGAISKRWERQA